MTARFPRDLSDLRKKLPVRNRNPPFLFRYNFTLYCRVSDLCAQEMKGEAQEHLPVLHRRTFWLKNLLLWSFWHWLTDSKVQGDGVKCQLGKLSSLFYGTVFSGKKKPTKHNKGHEEKAVVTQGRSTLNSLHFEENIFLTLLRECLLFPSHLIKLITEN